MRLSLFARMALILALGLLGTQLVSLWLHWGERATIVTQTRGQHWIDRVAEIVRVLEAEGPDHRAAALAALRSSDLRIQPIDASQVAPYPPRGQFQATIAARLGNDIEVRSAGGGMGMGGGMGSGMGPGMGRRHGEGPGGRGGLPPRSLDLRLSDGQWIRIAMSADTETPPLPTDYVIELIVSLLVVSALVMFAVRQATRPLQQLARAADDFGSNLDAPPLPENGPSETRQAAQAFNRMQGRIRRLVEERSRALAAVSHDLRTPLTRLRLRTELVADERLREQMDGDLDAMAAMIDATLDYLRSLRENETPQAIDIDALLGTVADDAGVLGHDVVVTGSGVGAPFTGRLTALRRALQNLVDNAVKYGHRARLRTEDDGITLRLFVDDDGPGIPAEHLDRVTDPYYRIDASRNPATGGIGLGLSIVSDVARLHRGNLELRNRPEGGLSACLALPRNTPSH